MVDMKIGIVGGTFDNDGGKPSQVVHKMCYYISKRFPLAKSWNGGPIAELSSEFMDNFICGVDVLIWMPLVSNSEDKVLPLIKKRYPHLFLIQSKSLLNGEYNSFQLVKRLLDSHAALGLIISRPTDELRFSLIDPLGNRWCDEVPLEESIKHLAERLEYVTGLLRIGSKQSGNASSFVLEPEFLDAVKYMGEEFTEHVMAANPNRFLGNASTRCCHGFPSARAQPGKGGGIYVSRRNVDKTIISSDEFVRVNPSTWDLKVKYEGDNKPSVDTPVQLELYSKYANVNYIIHGHVYIDGAPFTDRSIPCGYCEEADEIFKVQPDLSATNFVVNLRGHGCLILAGDINYLTSHKLISRPIFEDQEHT